MFVFRQVCMYLLVCMVYISMCVYSVLLHVYFLAYLVPFE